MLSSGKEQLWEAEGVVADLKLANEEHKARTSLLLRHLRLNRRLKQPPLKQLLSMRPKE